MEFTDLLSLAEVTDIEGHYEVAYVMGTICTAGAEAEGGQQIGQAAAADT